MAAYKITIPVETAVITYLQLREKEHEVRKGEPLPPGQISEAYKWVLYWEQEFGGNFDEFFAALAEWDQE